MMLDSFLIKNHNIANFDSYYQMMRKRKTGFGGEQQQARETDSPSPLKVNAKMSDPVPKSEVYGIIKGRMPTARDGHSAVLLKNMIVVFGGDRHRMPFSDTFLFDVQKTLEGEYRR